MCASGTGGHLNRGPSVTFHSQEVAMKTFSATLYAMVAKAGLKSTTVVVKGGLFDGGFPDLSISSIKLPS